MISSVAVFFAVPSLSPPSTVTPVSVVVTLVSVVVTPASGTANAGVSGNASASRLTFVFEPWELL